MHLFNLLVAEGRNDDRDRGDPDVLAAEELADEVQERIACEAGEQTCNDAGNPDDNDGVCEVISDVLQGDVLAGPERSSLRLRSFLGSARLDLFDVRMTEVLAEELGARASDQDEEVCSHQQVICNGCSRGEIVTGSILRSHSRKVDAAADVGAGHHGSDLCKTLCVAERTAQDIICDESADNRADCADQEDDQHTARVFPDAAEVALQKQQRNCHRNDDAPDDIVIKRRVGGDNAEVREHHSHDQRDDSAGDLGCPLIFLLEEDGQRDADTHDTHQTPDVVCCNQGMAQKLFE